MLWLAIFFKNAHWQMGIAALFVHRLLQININRI